MKAFGIGQAKSGTASLVGLLAEQYAAAHEPERAALLEVILGQSRREIGTEELRTYLLDRDQRLHLDYDVAWANQFVVWDLLPAFPGARIVALIRDPYTWLHSIVGHLLSRQIPTDVRPFLDWWFKPEQFPHTPEDAVLRAHGLYSVAAFLAAWERFATLCESLPPDRTLILRTHELTSSHQRLADFLDIPIGSLDVSRGRLNHSTWVGDIDELVARSYLHDAVHEVCGAAMSRHFPEITRIEDVDGLWHG